MKIFIDESGDPGFKIGSGSTEYFSFALVVVKTDTDHCRIKKSVFELKRVLSLSNEFEFKFQKSSHKHKLEFFKNISELPFTVRIILVDKKIINSPELKNNNKKFYNYMLKLVIKNNNKAISNALLYLDGESKREFKQELSKYLKAEIKTEEDAPIIRKFSTVRSHKEPCIQIADMFAGMARRRATKADCNKTKEYFEIVKSRIEDFWEFDK